MERTHLIHKIIRRIVIKYKKTESKLIPKQFGQCGKNVSVDYPIILSHPELITIGDNTTILSNARIQLFPELNGAGSLKIGANCFFLHYLCILVGDDITIGNDVLIASHVLISSQNHGMDPENEQPYMSQELSCKKVVIEDGCWIGERVCINAGVHIGKKCVIGSGSVVTHDIPDYSIAVGVPAKIIKQYDFSRHEWIRL